jgi:hypothetical protein
MEKTYENLAYEFCKLKKKVTDLENDNKELQIQIDFLYEKFNNKSTDDTCGMSRK